MKDKENTVNIQVEVITTGKAPSTITPISITGVNFFGEEINIKLETPTCGQSRPII